MLNISYLKKLLLILSMVIGFNQVLLAGELSSRSVQGESFIKIGLESIAGSKKEIVLQSDKGFNVGEYIRGNFFTSFSIKENQITIKNGLKGALIENYTFNSYEEALEAALLYEGIPVYLGDEMYSLFIQNEAGPIEDIFVVYDEIGSILFTFKNSPYNNVAFQGEKTGYSFPVTTLNKRNYRGAIEFVSNSKGVLTGINHLSMEEYLYGVVPSEMVSSWPEEALKAQAVASRSMANYQYNRFIKKGYNLVDTTTSQVYKGLDVETERTNQAVDATRNEVVLYDGKIAETLYFSTSGGYTEDPMYVWGNNVPYLKAKEDIYEIIPESGEWTRVITIADLEKCLKAKNIFIGEVLDLKIIEKTPSNRVSKLMIKGTEKDYILEKEEIRTFFSSIEGGSLKSRMFIIEGKEDILPTLPNLDSTIEPTQELFAISEDGVDALKEYVTVNGSIDFTEPVYVQTENEKNSLVLESNKIEDKASIKEKELFNPQFVLKGKGFGHGVGMSQSGARGMADLGFSYKEILEFYYTDIEISR